MWRSAGTQPNGMSSYEDMGVERVNDMLNMWF